MNKKTVALAGVTTFAVGVIGLTGLAGITAVSAQDNLEEYPLIIQNLAEKFGVAPDEVKAVFEETRVERRENKLEELVEEGTITEEQKAMIIEKQEEMHETMQEIKNSDMSDEEKREAMRELKDEMKEWAEENDIPLPERGKGRFGRGMHRGGMGMEL